MTPSKSDFRTVLITGGCGYLGSQLIRDLAVDPNLEGLKVRILDNMQEKNYPALMNLPAGGAYQFIEGDILDPSVVAYALQEVDVVVHLAAVVRTPMSFENPTWVEQVNHWGTAWLVESCLEAGVKRLIFASSTAVYGPGGSFSEEDICRPFGAYAQSKFKAEHSILSAIPRGLQPVILRFGTIFGPAPTVRFDAVANRFAYLAGCGRSLVVYGRGDQVRPFIHVGDASAAIRFSLQQMDEMTGQTYNIIGSNASILDLVETVRSIHPAVEVRYTEQDILTHLSIEATGHKILEQGWQPSFSLADGMGALIQSFSGLQS